jgi:uncharacterized protein YacL (UPF0231 family)
MVRKLLFGRVDEPGAADLRMAHDLLGTWFLRESREERVAARNVVPSGIAGKTDCRPGRVLPSGRAKPGRCESADLRMAHDLLGTWFLRESREERVAARNVVPSGIAGRTDCRPGRVLLSGRAKPGRCESTALLMTHDLLGTWFLRESREERVAGRAAFFSREEQSLEGASQPTCGWLMTCSERGSFGNRGKNGLPPGTWLLRELRDGRLADWNVAPSGIA